jgi:hypothetical protein
MSNVPIIPVSKGVITSFRPICQNVTLFTNASFIVLLFDADGVELGRQTVDLSTEEYLAWNNNDDYILNLIATRLGFTLAPVVVEPEPVVETV